MKVETNTRRFLKTVIYFALSALVFLLWVYVDYGDASDGGIDLFWTRATLALGAFAWILLLCLNDRVLLDFKSHRKRFLWFHKSTRLVDFSHVRSLGINSSCVQYESGSPNWSYGISLLTSKGDLVEILSPLEANRESIVRDARILADLLGIPMEPGSPMHYLVVKQSGLEYTSEHPGSSDGCWLFILAVPLALLAWIAYQFMSA